MESRVSYDKNEIWLENVTTVSTKTGEVIEPTLENLSLILENDSFIADHITFNEFTGNYEYKEEGKENENWCSYYDSLFMSYIEKAYGIYNERKYFQALEIVMKKRSYHPIKDLIENKEWDGKERIDNFLKHILKCDCSTDELKDYHREVSRMIFNGGIARLYHPGIKFDYMPILIGKQGLGKSTIVKWLALNDKYENDISTIEGKEGIESLEGGWICEFSELLAMTRQKDVQSLKAFITRNTDKYRRPYDRYTVMIPRSCIFIGTTNDSEFLTDTTGNRRYLPVEIMADRCILFDKEEYIRNYILECWREALYKMRNKDKAFYLTIPVKYSDTVMDKQEDRLIEDPRLSELEEFLSQKKPGEKVCARMIWAEAFRGISKDATSNDFKRISTYMDKFKDWKRHNNPTQFEKYGRQKYWRKQGGILDDYEDDLD